MPSTEIIETPYPDDEERKILNFDVSKNHNPYLLFHSHPNPNTERSNAILPVNKKANPSSHFPLHAPSIYIK